MRSSEFPPYRPLLYRQGRRVKKRNIAQVGQEQSITKHLYDDLAPLLLHPEDPSKHYYDPKNIQNIWIPYDISYAQAMQLKKQMQDFLKMSSQERADYMQNITDVKTITLPDCLEEKCDLALIGQWGVFASQDLPAFTIIGIYSGVFIRSREDLLQLSKQQPAKDICDYLFRVCEETGWPKISAYQYGNRTSLINAASNYQYGFEQGIQTVLKRRNIISAYAKTSQCPVVEIAENTEAPDVLYLITCESVAQGTQLFYDYGVDYWQNG